MEWNIETLRQHVDSIIAEKERRVDDRFDAAVRDFTVQLVDLKRAIQRLDEQHDKRFSAIEATRSVLIENQARAVPRTEIDLIIRVLHERIDKVEDSLNELQSTQQEMIGKSSGASGLWIIMLSIVGMLSGVASVILQFVR